MSFVRSIFLHVLFFFPVPDEVHMTMTSRRLNSMSLNTTRRPWLLLLPCDRFLIICQNLAQCLKIDRSCRTTLCNYKLNSSSSNNSSSSSSNNNNSIHGISSSISNNNNKNHVNRNDMFPRPGRPA